MHLQITMSGGLFVMTSMFVTRDDATTTHMLYTFWRRIPKLLCTRQLKTTFDNGSKEFPFNTFSTLISLIDGSSMILNATNFQVHSKTTCKSTRKGKKTKQKG